ncbi:hypothetical protein PAPYR_3231 [Paratrimastix pyriformis]|uniref:Uncharacterized protein n=1 Tax=Paratrimastix pyriformis TaxID=342808 RepID=A0ABQ8UQM4_9EUKA|nr:hypothetical protein PAPYR_3231 [Paratrimastix pyriformis]
MLLGGLNALSGGWAHTHLSANGQHLKTEDLRPPLVGQHLQTVLLSCNDLVSLEPLNITRNLTTLDASHNALTSLASLSAGTFSNLVSIDISHNRLRTLEGLDRLSRLRRVVAHDNALESLVGLPVGAPCLHELQLAQNALASIEGLAVSLPKLHLNVAHNRVESLAPLAGHGSLEELDASNNGLPTVGDGFGDLPMLHSLDLRANRLANLHETLGPSPRACPA